MSDVLTLRAEGVPIMEIAKRTGRELSEVLELIRSAPKTEVTPQTSIDLRGQVASLRAQLETAHQLANELRRERDRLADQVEVLRMLKDAPQPITMPSAQEPAWSDWMTLSALARTVGWTRETLLKRAADGSYEGRKIQTRPVRARERYGNTRTLYRIEVG